MQALYPIATVCVLVLSQTPTGSPPQNPMQVGKGQRLEALKLRNDPTLADYLAGRVLAADGVLMRYTNLSAHLDRAAKGDSLSRCVTRRYPPV